MRILFDECVDRRLKKEFEAYGHEVTTVQELGLDGKNEREIAKDEKVSGKFDVYLTTEKNRFNTFQKDIGRLAQYKEEYSLAFIIVDTGKDFHPEYKNVKPMMPTIQNAIENANKGTLVKAHRSGVCQFYGLERTNENYSNSYKSEIREEKQPIKQEQDRGITFSR